MLLKSSIIYKSTRSLLFLRSSDNIYLHCSKTFILKNYIIKELGHVCIMLSNIQKLCSSITVWLGEVHFLLLGIHANVWERRALSSIQNQAGIYHQSNNSISFFSAESIPTFMLHLEILYQTKPYLNNNNILQPIWLRRTFIVYSLTLGGIP